MQSHCNPHTSASRPVAYALQAGSMEGEGEGEGGAGSDWGRAYVVPDVPMICPILQRGMCTSTHG